MKKRHFNKASFILMGLILVELITIVQAVFSQQVIKYSIEQQLEHTSEILLSQFVNSYEMNSAFQGNITKLSYQHFDQGLVALYNNMIQVLNAKGTLGGNRRYINEDGDYQIEVMDNTRTNRNMYVEQYGVDVSKIDSYKIVSYEMKQRDQLLLERRVLMGLSKDRKKIVTIEVELKSLQEKVAVTNRKIDELLNATYYLGANKGNFYVFESSGKVLYSGGGENNVDYFEHVDLNTNKKIMDIIHQESNVYQQVIYEKHDEIKRSMMRVHYDKEKHLYFVYENDQKKTFEVIEQKMLLTWVVSLVILVLTLCFMYVLKRMVKPTMRE